MKLSVIILNYNVCHFLEQCIRSVKAAIADIDAEIIVVDNCSPDNSAAMVSEKFPDVVLISNDNNIGFARANNQAAALAKGTYLCILNPDTVVGEDVFIKALAFAEAQRQFGILGSKLIDGTGNFLPESKRGLPTPGIALTKMWSATRSKKYYASHLQENDSGEVEVLVGAFMLLKKELYRQVGGFDERYFMYGEDIDLSYTVLQAGYRNFYFGETAIIHYKGESTVKNYEYARRFSKAMSIFYKKHYRGNFFVRFVISIGANLFSLLRVFGSTKNEDDDVFSDRLFLSKNSERIRLFKATFRENSAVCSAMSQIDRYKQQNMQLIIDGDSYSNQQIIAIMETFKNTGLTFRIWPKDCNFIIGSDSSDGKGIVHTL
ncbi:glycosyltransferase family 2 protein [Sungkyunkwania multivorans]|uniref:Glycosyltransferase family 2 protein n=1 Tax=Sungkyunkwania multivorans TaxID=1173618 RepID=A0ABW3CU77_9FLAO